MRVESDGSRREGEEGREGLAGFDLARYAIARVNAAVHGLHKGEGCIEETILARPFPYYSSHAFARGKARRRAAWC